MALLVAVSLAVFAPEGAYFVRHRQELLLRGAQVSVFNPTPEAEGSHDTPLQSVLNTAGMFFVRGDENVRHNIPHRPVFDPLLAAFFVAGLGLSVWRARSDARFRWPLLWLVVMCLPSALSHESPNSFRVVSAAPAAFFFPGLSLAELVRRWAGRQLGLRLAGLVVAASAGVTLFLYFDRWAQDPRTYWAYDGNLTPLAALVRAQTQPGHVYFALDHRSTVQFLAPVSQTDRWYREESAAIPIQTAPVDTVYVSGPRAALAGIAGLALLGAQPLPHTTAPDGSADFYAFRWPASAAAELLAGRQTLDVSMTCCGSRSRRRDHTICTSTCWMPAAGRWRSRTCSPGLLTRDRPAMSCCSRITFSTCRPAPTRPRSGPCTARGRIVRCLSGRQWAWLASR